MRRGLVTQASFRIFTHIKNKSYEKSIQKVQTRN
jgi:hypothetical protein